MAEPTTTVKADRNADFTYELAITSDVMEAVIRHGRERDNSTTKPGTCLLRIDNSAGDYTPKGANTPLRPMHGIQVVADSQNIFTGFIRRVFLHPTTGRQDMTIDCADWLWVLSRIDISLPLMLNVRSDILAHRIADLAEIGEHVDNPRFRTDLTGYSDVGTVTNTRVTSGDVLEGPAAQESVTTAINSGWRYAIPHDADADFQSVKITASTYVWATTDDDVGETFTLRLADSVTASIATATVTLTRLPQRVTVSGTFGGAATDFYIEGYMTSAAATFRTGAVHCVSFINAIPRSFDDGQSTFSHIAPRRIQALRALQEVADNELGGYIYVNGSGTLMFEDKHHRWRETASITSQGTIDETMVDVPYEEDAADLIGEVELHYAMWVEGDAGTQVFAEDELPRSIPPNGTLTIDGDYGSIIREHIVPVANTDFFIRSQPDGDAAGSDETGNVALAFEDFGGGFQAIFTSSVARTTHLTSLRVRGTPVRPIAATPQEIYTPSGAPDYASKLKFSYRLATGQPGVEAWAQYLGDRYVTQRERLPVRLLNKTAAILTEMTDRVISERMTIRNDNTDYSAKVNGDYYIDAIMHWLSQGKTQMETVWSLVPVDLAYFIIDTDSIDGAAVLAP